MSGLLFVSQQMIDAWAELGKIEFEGNVMTLRGGAGQGRTYALDPAVRFLHVVGADRDPHGLVAKVKSQAALRELGAECLGSSVVLGEVAYEVQPGFLAETSAQQAGQGAPALMRSDLEGKRVEAEALARFLLENLS